MKVLLEDAQEVGLAFIKPRGAERVREHRKALEKALEKLKSLPGEDADAVYAMLKRLLDEGRTLALIFAKSELVPGIPREFLGIQANTYTNPYTKQRTHGYATPLARLIEFLVETAFNSLFEMRNCTRHGLRVSALAVFQFSI